MKRVLTLLLTIAGFIAFLPSCQKAPELSLSSPTTVELSVDGSSGSITFTANRDWTANCSDNWIYLSQSSGTASKGDVTVFVSCKTNTTYEDRTATVTIIMEELSQTVTVRQPANLGVVLPQQFFDLQASDETIEVEIKANVQYSVSTSVGWIKQIGTKALSSNILVFSIEENMTYDPREGSIFINPQDGNTQKQIISVRQAARQIPEPINMGLSVKWGSFNLGATKPEEYGDYFAWGETSPKYNYSFSTYKWCNGERTGITKYYPIEDRYMWGGTGGPDLKGQLELNDDAAHIILSENWRIPTFEEWQELIRNCTWSWIHQNGVGGLLVTSKKNGNSIFLPGGGRTQSTGAFSNVGSGCYWTSTILKGDDPSTARMALLTPDNVSLSWSVRAMGLSVRPVTE